jgi:hypothetical protein
METAANLITNLFKHNGHVSKCEVCDNEYEKCFEVRIHGETHIFDSFECAIHALAPRCAHCGCPIIGHGLEAEGYFYCCAHCASQTTVRHLKDQAVSEMERSPS